LHEGCRETFFFVQARKEAAAEDLHDCASRA
jgi:hypothetical protein